MIARKLDSSAIAEAPPYAREVWLYLLRTANYEDTKICKRGQTIRRYIDIREALKWYVGYRKCMYSVAQCENAMKLLRRANMIATMRTTRGLCITICNYSFYQTAGNYESHSLQPDTSATMEPQGCPTINKKVKKDKKKEEKLYCPTSDEVRLASILGCLILVRKPDHKKVLAAQKNGWQAWAVHVDRMLHIDNRDIARAKEVIEWAQADTGNGDWPGWQNNIMCTETLRKKFDTLELRMAESTPPQTPLRRGSDGLTPREQLLGVDSATN